uniref:hypothetical protein n=1 Tax=Methylobacterium sp. B34 TaxID=95563 RepID=UPI000FE13E3F|nr:hypothetical protein [Methylobacterium sp. B34]
MLTQQEALDFVKSGAVPAHIQAGIDALSDANTRFQAEMLICGATSFERANAMVPTLGQILGLDSAALDALWILGATF